MFQTKKVISCDTKVTRNVSNLFRTLTLFGQTLNFNIIFENCEAFQSSFLQKQTICVNPSRTIPSCTSLVIKE
uniref:Uncharacterized protein n=1 Tax=Arundo donax TaxID=35708 RepID=A0A0A9F4K5_ARUDO